MDQNNPSITGFAQFAVVRAPQPSPQNNLKSDFFWKIGVAESPQPLRVGTWNLRQSIQDPWKNLNKCPRGIWANFTPRQNHRPKKSPFWENLRKGPVFQVLAGDFVEAKNQPKCLGTFFRFAWVLNRLAQVSGPNSQWLWRYSYPDFSKNEISDCFGGTAGGPGPLKIGQNRLWRGYFGPFMP